MGCCGCTLQTSAIVAAVFGIIQSVAGLITGIALLTSFFSVAYSSFVISNVLISATVFNGLWLVATIVLIIGIVKENAAMHRVWVGATSIIMVVDLAHTIAFIVGFVNASIARYSVTYRYVSSYSYETDLNGIFLFCLIMTAVSRGSIWLWIVNICLTIYTAYRANEIERGPVHSGQTVFVYGNQPAQSYAAVPGHTIVIQHGGPYNGNMPPTYDYQQPQYGQPPAHPAGTQEQGQDQGIPPKH